MPQDGPWSQDHLRPQDGGTILSSHGGLADPDPSLFEVLDELPPASAAFAYGSGVFHQPGLYDRSQDKGPRPMIDFILTVEDPVDWHRLNLARNPSHYSCCASCLGANAVSRAAEGLGAGVYFNTLIPMPGGKLVKYGVIHRATLERDLRAWDALYCAGRLHKPVAWVKAPSATSTLEGAVQSNLQSAFRVALLLLGPEFTQEDLLHTICALSYTGDVRMGWAEDSGKLQRLVRGSRAGLDRLYGDALAQAQVCGLIARSTDEGWSLPNPEALFDPAALAALPAALMARLRVALGAGSTAAAAEALSDALRLDPQRGQRLLRTSLSSIVRSSSARQAVLGLLSAGLTKSATYGLAKLRKAWT